EQYLKSAGFQVESWETTGHPVIFAQNMSAGEDKPTVMIYNHYDVQPVDPLDLWESPPFEPTVREGEVFARGAVDDKGQCFYVMNAVKAMLEMYGTLPVNVKLCIDGEEECASPGLSSILKQKKEELAADHLMIADGGFAALHRPELTLGVRGIVSMRVEVTGSKMDLHSGTHGGMAYNPNHALVEMLARLRDDSGKITVPGFYDDIIELTEEEKKRINFRFNPERYESLFGAKATGGEKDYTPRESSTIRPTLEINGIGGGYTGSGMKTVIPARAMANISCRLVPNQDPVKIGKMVAKFLQEIKPEGVDVNITMNPGMGKAIRTTPDSKVVRAAARAYEEVLDTPCGYLLGGGSIPIVPELTEVSGGDVVIMGYGLNLDNVHAPNEHFGLDRLKMGFVTIARTLELLAE
ncbi:MAG: dipeptidase, partial [Deltaproteobacteria bacterium]|nr:dipeptidase [Deltaproteobacteria bacterium]